MNTSPLAAFLPEGILEYFDISDIKDSKDSIDIHLVEKPLQPNEFGKDKISSKGFFEEVTVKDFPVRGKDCFLHIKRRRWENETLDKIVSRDWSLVAKGTRLTADFAAFLKELHRQHPGELQNIRTVFRS